MSMPDPADAIRRLQRLTRSSTEAMLHSRFVTDAGFSAPAASRAGNLAKALVVASTDTALSPRFPASRRPGGA